MTLLTPPVCRSALVKLVAVVAAASIAAAGLGFLLFDVIGFALGAMLRPPALPPYCRS